MGVVEPDEVDRLVVMEAALPWLGEVDGVWGDWTPLKDAVPCFPNPGTRKTPGSSPTSGSPSAAAAEAARML